ncbi:hypothetical protein C1J03_05660 [Sulfitobacter sp. SK012]|uniref:hypothetical protein n=1 Tax=Sulfitobacter sp. SK012 TaxID=1389005 RepID=UPI000E09FEC3|nr:hypothetical protein [Sulfitobacter sp. SK012]AXI45566.1 hypothetical protein C1J03_05660 [Sulfitobacter sp. SK012]
MTKRELIAAALESGVQGQRILMSACAAHDAGNELFANKLILEADHLMDATDATLELLNTGQTDGWDHELAGRVGECPA